MKKNVIKLFWLAISSFLGALGIKIFIQASSMLTGGVGGISIIIARVISNVNSTQEVSRIQLESMLYAILFFVLNIPIFILGFKKVGKKFSLYSFFHVLLSSVLVAIIPLVWRDSLGDIMQDKLLVAILAGILTGTASSLAFMKGFSGGGMDIVIMYFSNHYKKNIAMYSFILDILVLMTGYLVFRDLNSLIYTIIYVFSRSVVLNILYKRNKLLYLEIVTEKGDLLSSTLIEKNYRTSTISEVKGAYSNSSKQQINLVISYVELKEYINIIKNIDPSSFVIVSEAKEIHGNFTLPSIE